MIKLLKQLSPLSRMVNSPGIDQAFSIIKKRFPNIIIHEYPAGSKCEDWIVPDSWSVKKGILKDQDNKTIASTKDHPLFVAPYSEPVNGWFSKKEIEKHLTTRPDQGDAFALEHRYAYNYHLNDWGISLPYNRWDKLPEGKYYVEIEVELKKTSMKVAEYFLPGKQKETICIAAHIDELTNDNLSGCVVALELINYLEKLKNRKFSYQILLLPETIGTFFYIKNNYEKVKNTIGMLYLETLGAGEEWCLKKAFRGGGHLEYAMREAMKKVKLSHKELDFFSGYGNDERIYGWPTINIPGISLQRLPFKQYHTSNDNPSIINKQYLLEALKAGQNFIKIFEENYIPQFINLTPPWLSRHHLYYDCVEDTKKFHQYNNLVLYNINGINSILDLANISGLSFFEVYNYLNKFIKKGFY